MSKLLTSVLFGLAVAAAAFFFSDALLVWSGGRAHENLPRIMLTYGFLAGAAVYWPKPGAFIAFILVLVFLAGVLIVGWNGLESVKNLFVVIVHTLPFFLPYLWSVGHFDLFRNARRKPT